ncbi:16S rRNA (uracil(1498)-N(3))-methyltransferase [Lachnoclostridium sp.]|uniref:16S rRNA (uracil(1498)-N(3))-methyltransferase n=1 Tax=Lachnoclostridium sp. TaxID=2028282 RepID=UPI00289BE4D9|nr:16S rRNA (uracil(1498)-N(3))-methyltransferase [Lachnoclostridium sp.]
MQRFYIESTNISDTTIRIDGADVNHIKNVLRMKIGEKLIACDGQGNDYCCIIAEFEKDNIILSITERKKTDTELPAKLILFQGLPKKDKMELIVQKAVELGAYEIVPVMMKRTIVKLEDKKKEQKKLERWQAIAEGAAKQSGRGFIPRVHEIVSYQDAIKMASECDMSILPYECASGIKETRELINQSKGKTSIGVMIGPEGGFEEEEIDLAKEHGITPVTLGKRILRTETAGLAMLSYFMLTLEEE